MSNRAHKVTVTILLVLIIAVLAYLVRSVFVPKVPMPPEPKAAPVSKITIQAEAEAIAHPILPGGVKNVADLRRLIQENADVAKHYEDANFDINCATDEILAFDMWASVSYRLGNHFAYTHRPVLLLAGEHIIVDNCHGVLIRAQCANVILLAAKYPESPTTGQPTETLILPVDIPQAPETPPIIPPIVPPLAPIPAPPVPVLPPTGTDWYPPVICCGVPLGSPTKPPVTTDESGSTAFFASAGILILILVRKGKTDAE